MSAYPPRRESLFRRFGRDERGAALVLVTVMLPVLVGFSLLAIDMSRVNNLHNDLQKAADAFALAAAAELDGKGDSEDRAERALANLVQNASRFSDDGTNILTRDGDITWRFLEELPASDADAITDDPYLSEDPTESRFIEVTVTPTGFSSIFPASFLGGANSFTVGATAVGGFAGVVTCDMTPLFICNPFPEDDLGEIVTNYSFYRSGIRLVPGDQLAPGNFGFLRPESAHGYGEQDLADDLARAHVPECVNTLGIFTQTGTLTVPATNAINTRFDMGYSQGVNGFSKTDASVAPAPNVRKGYDYVRQGNQPVDACNMAPGEDPNLFMGFPRDDMHVAGSTELIADGQWDFEAYVAVNNLDVSGFLDQAGQPYSNANPPSRYDLYMYEIENNLVSTPSDGLESGTPACHSEVAGPERRLVYAAIVNCDLYEEELQGQSGAAQAIGYASFFLTEPSNGTDVYAEIVDIDGIEGRGTMIDFARDNVQLYR